MSFNFDVEAVQRSANQYPAFVLSARHWSARLLFDMGSERYLLTVDNGQISKFEKLTDDVKSPESEIQITISAPEGSWHKLLQSIPPAPYDDIRFGGQAVGFEVKADIADALGPYYGAIQDFVEILRRARSGERPPRPVANVQKSFDSAVGRYMYIDIEGVQYRVYFEEAGEGDIPLLLQHTAGADGRQWRHVLEDPDYQRHYRMISYDLPYHGRSLPPTSEPWWEQEYRLTKDWLIKAVLAISTGLELDRPVFMGCSVGGHLAPDLALYHPDQFRAVIGINSGLAVDPAKINLETEESWFHPRIGNQWKAAAMLGNTAPTSPEAYRRETGWIYSQGAPSVLKGDVYYYSQDHDLTEEQAQTIDTSKVAVYLLTGEYDPLAAETGTARLAKNIMGCHFQILPGLGHFGPSENPEDFKQVLLPVLQEIAQ
jgi:pimeloyl-ACP methyl ester carboxylesterase